MEGNRYDVIYVHPSRGKKIVTGAKTKERLGYIANGSVILNVHEADIATQSNFFVCATCSKPFSVQGETAWCDTCHPQQRPVTPQLARLAPRHASERLLASSRRQAGFDQPSQQLLNQQNSRQGVAPIQGGGARGQMPNRQPAPIAAQNMSENQLPAMPPPPGKSDLKNVISQAKQAKSRAFGIPVVEPGAIGPPPDLSGTPEIHVVKPSADIADLDLGRSVNSRHVRILRDKGIVTLADARDRGRDALIDISGIGPSVADTLLSRAET